MAEHTGPSPEHIMQVGLEFWSSKTLLSAVEMEARRRGPFALTEKPKSFGIWLSSTVSAMPFM